MKPAAVEISVFMALPGQLSRSLCGLRGCVGRAKAADVAGKGGVTQLPIGAAGSAAAAAAAATHSAAAGEPSARSKQIRRHRR